jgi:hypothetical protein
MFTFELFAPWLTFAVVLFALLYVQRWIHRHLFGVGFLLSREKHAATLAYYLTLMPGVILHEFSHYITAYVLGYNAKKFELFPHAQEDGSLEMGFVQLDKIKNPVFAALVGSAPLILGMIATAYISSNVLGLPAFVQSLGSADLDVIGTAFNIMIKHPDFWLWTYILFGIANAMMPGREERQAWRVLAVAFGLFVGFLLLIGGDVILYNFISGPVNNALTALTAVFGTVLLLDCFASAIIYGLEYALEHITGHKVEYQPAIAAPKQAPALPAGLPTSIYDLELPLPPLPGGTVKRTPVPTLTPAAARPSLGAPPKPPELPKPPIGGPPAVRPAVSPAPKPSFGAPPRSSANDDYIDADVIDGDDINQDRRNTPRNVRKGDGGISYEDVD